jgi:GntR family transcriptional repressor for pyruvate dehydrogenase complex
MALPENLRLDAPKTLPDRIAEHFMARVFVGELAPGERLPPDRELAQQLGVDRTSLRMAMQQLSRMGLVRAVRGSGVSVLDYREHAGLDFLAAVFTLPQLSLGGGFLLQTLDDWLDLIPFVVGRAFSRATDDDFHEMDALFTQQLALCEKREGNAGLAKIVQLEVALQNRVFRMLGNTGFMLFNNSSRPLRARMAKVYFETIDVRGHVGMHRKLLRDARGGAPPEELARGYRANLQKRTGALRKRLQAMPTNPSIIESRRPARTPGKGAAPANEMPTTPRKRGNHADIRPMDRTV